MSDQLCLNLQGVHTHIGQYHILQGVDMKVPRGGVTMLLGRNGAGKTTTMRTIMGLWQASQGSVTFNGSDITKMETHDISKNGISYVPEDMGIFSALSVKENMILAARTGEMDEARLDWIFQLFPAMKKFWNWPAGNLSGGQKQMLAISRAVIEPSSLLLVDEPTKGLAPAIIGALTEAFVELKQTDTTILMVEQNFQMAKTIGDTVCVMDDGRVVHSGKMSDLAENEQLQEQLLGLSMGAHQ
ncbi:ABC transporter ATP-binding protein [Terasakiella pusilla]|jgi:branched-chain amino acid transport system ATP-binding protein|uniref:ABC transporter ATP-binding protein n=1 Tax=Terasakiella pusilla TaxID=64973 RepID=UPI00048A985D|nr:ABC transporter ATP-binding protein [Terasakiella pusilla]